MAMTKQGRKAVSAAQSARWAKFREEKAKAERVAERRKKQGTKKSGKKAA